MAHDLDESHADKSSIIKELFVATADDNYVVARWCYLEGMNVDFLWLAVHCLEKYLKAVLLFNGHSAKSYGHDIVELYAAVYPLAPELLPNDLTKPQGLDFPYWHAETVGPFLERLYRDGQADNRYQLFGYVRHAEDLFKLDEMVFRIRRMCQPLEAHFLSKKRDNVPDLSNRDCLRERPRCAHRLYSKLEDTFDGKRGEALQHAAISNNFSFAPDRSHEPLPYGSTAQNPVLVRRLYDPLEMGPQYFSECDHLWKWVQDNIYIPKPLVKEIDDERKKLKTRWNAGEAGNGSIREDM